MEKINVFWTGGLDSTYRICELSRMEVEIQPYYLKMPNRPSTNEELKAIDVISKNIYARTDTKAILNPIIVIDTKDLVIEKEQWMSYNWIKEHNVVEWGLKRFPIQYLYCAAFCKQANIFIEIAMEFEPHSRIVQILHNYGNMQVVNYNGLSYKYLLPPSQKTGKQTHPHLFNILGRFRFPLPLGAMSKLEERDQLVQWGMDDIILETWFCHHPINGEACGFCSPCRQVVIAGMEYRLSKKALLRHKLQLPYLLYNDKIKPLMKRLKQIFLS